jgi:hypothetical protein
MAILRIVGIGIMLAGLTVFVLGVFLTNRPLGLIVAVAGMGIILGGVVVTNHAQRFDLGPGQ